MCVKFRLDYVKNTRRNDVSNRDFNTFVCINRAQLKSGQHCLTECLSSPDHSRLTTMVYSFQAQSSPEIYTTYFAITISSDILIPSKTTKFVHFSFLHWIIDHMVTTQHSSSLASVRL